MVSRDKLISRIGLGAFSLLAGWALLGAGAAYRTRESRTEAVGFLRDFARLRVGESQLGEVTRLVDRYHGKWREGTTSGAGSACGEGASIVDFTFENLWLHWFLFAPLTSFAATIYVKDNLVCFHLVSMVTTAGGVTGVTVREFRQSPLPRPFSVQLNPSKTLVTMDTSATATERRAAYSFNLDCMTNLRGCRSALEMAPAIWQSSREVAPAYWKSQWDD